MGLRIMDLLGDSFSPYTMEIKNTQVYIFILLYIFFLVLIYTEYFLQIFNLLCDKKIV